MNCTCGHPRDQHQHYRPGTDCGHCNCPEYRPPTLLARFAAFLRRT